MAKHHVQSALRAIIALVVIAILLSPGFLMALVYTDLNFLVALVAVLSVVAARRHSMLRWGLAAVAAFVIAVPPYPFWVFSSQQRGWYLHFFSGFTLQTAPIGTFVAYFLASLALFAVLFWALRSSKRQANA